MLTVIVLKSCHDPLGSNPSSLFHRQLFATDDFDKADDVMVVSPQLVLHLSRTCPEFVTTRFRFRHLPLFWWIYHHISVLKGIILTKQQVTEETYEEQWLIADAFIQVTFRG